MMYYSVNDTGILEKKNITVHPELHLIIPSVSTVEPLHNGHLGDRRKWPL